MIDETENFMDAMGDVKPLKQEKRVSLGGSSLDKATIQTRRQAAQSEDLEALDPLANSGVDRLEPTATLEFQRPGVQHGVYRQLRSGKYDIEARLDLHRMGVDQARLSVYQFVHDCLAHDIRCALLTHGKGEGRENPALLKSYVAHWLPQIPEVLAFHSAQRHHGGTGATYIMLKKSDKKKLETLEAHQRKR